MGRKRGTSPHPGVELLTKSDERGTFMVGRWWVPEAGVSGRDRKRRKLTLKSANKAMPEDMCREWAHNMASELRRMEWIASLGKSVPPHDVWADPSAPVTYRKVNGSVSTADLRELQIDQSKHLYGIRCMNRVKIGIATDPSSRRSALQVGCPVDVDLEFSVSGMAWAESHIHSLLHDERVRGEWFSGPLTNSVVSLMRRFDITSSHQEMGVLSSLRSVVGKYRKEIEEIERGEEYANPRDRNCWMHPMYAREHAAPQETPCP